MTCLEPELDPPMRNCVLNEVEMLLVRTRLGQSNRHGIGLFAAEFIPKGTVIWRRHPLFDASFSHDQVQQMAPPSREQFLNYAYFDKESRCYILGYDDHRFINHCSKNPNVASTPNEDVAARDINQGEELLCDYRKFEDTYFQRRGMDETQLL